MSEQQPPAAPLPPEQVPGAEARQRYQEQLNKMSKFQRATKQASRLRMALIGPAGSGKTYTSLLLGQALGGKLALIDTERGSASKYADLCEFDVLELTGSFHPERYVEAVKDAEASGYTTLVIDSLSHAWIGKDGGLDLHDKAVDRQKTKNSFTAWAEVTPHHNALVQALIQCRCHVIATMRARTEYVMDERNRPRKVGLGPVMRDGVEYEFDVVGDMDIEHNTLVVTKTRCPALAGQSFRKPGADLARILTSWLGGGEAAPANETQMLNGAVLIAPRTLVTEQQQAATAPAKPAPLPEVQDSPRQPARPQKAAKKSPSPPVNGADLEKRLRAFDAKLADARRCKPADLYGAVLALCRREQFPDLMADWNAEQCRLAMDTAIHLAREKWPAPAEAPVSQAN